MWLSWQRAGESATISLIVDAVQTLAAGAVSGPRSPAVPRWQRRGALVVRRLFSCTAASHHAVGNAALKASTAWSSLVVRCPTCCGGFVIAMREGVYARWRRRYGWMGADAYACAATLRMIWTGCRMRCSVASAEACRVAEREKENTLHTMYLLDSMRGATTCCRLAPR